MKLRQVTVNNRKAQLVLVTRSGKELPFPFSKLEPRPSAKDRITRAFVDRELGNEAVTYVLKSGAEGSVHVEHALEYNQDPSHLAELLAHKLTVVALQRIEQSSLSRRELARRLHTSVPQLYRLLDPAQPRKNLGQLVSLLHALDCAVDLVVTPRAA
jgi:predicted XRE-type DNA-binding protein